MRQPAKALLRRGFALEFVMLAGRSSAWWSCGRRNCGTVGGAGGFGLDSLIEIAASTVVIWELSGTGQGRQRWALRLIGYVFAALAAYLLVQSTLVLTAGYHPRHSAVGIGWTAATAAVMFTLAFGTARTGAALGNPVLSIEGRVTLVDAILPPRSWPAWR